MSAPFPHKRPLNASGEDMDGWYCDRPGCRQWCVNGWLATDCHGIGSGWPQQPRQQLRTRP